GFLSPAPCYGGIRGGISNDLKRIGNVKPILVQLGSQVNFDAGEKQPFQLTVDKFEKALQKATDEGINVRGLILINPNNPLGEIYSRELLMELLNFAHRHSLHVVVDEIYMGTIFKSDAVHTSIVNIDNLPDPQRTHMLWGVSKDFGMAGFRCGVCHSFNQHLHQALEYLGYFYAIPANVQHQLTEFLSDKEWLNNVFFPTNHQRLRETYQCMSDGLTKLGIAHLHRSAGLFIWADFRLYLRSQTYEAEMDLYNKFLSGGVNISPGHNFDCAEFGWFRIVFAHPTHELLIAIERIGKVLDEIKSEICGDSLELNLVGPDQPVLGAASHEDNTQKKEDCLEDLLTGLQHQIKTSNWLKDNTAEKWINENPMLYQEYKEAANKH
ncbi:1-aminocyclopropane-1-carboxylate synthase-like protein 1, partial [Saccoglossus kowalevskii]|uniref:1-aminocyclopropane-1-carboxylate synthase-like protein 1-like n=1 Tax=Saccoglossus kowalevskii TaxID=10224 RepID=A0ABM0M6P9_SACKO